MPCAPRKGKRLLSVLFEVLGEVPLVGRKTLIFTNRQPTCKMAPWFLGGEREWWFRFNMFFSLTPSLGESGNDPFWRAYFPIRLKTTNYIVEIEVWIWSCWGCFLYRFCSLLDFDLKCVLIVQMQTMISGKFGVGCLGWNLIISTLASTNSRTTQNKWQEQFQQARSMISTNIVFFPGRLYRRTLYTISLVFFPLKQGTPRGIFVSLTPVICCLAFGKLQVFRSLQEHGIDACALHGKVHPDKRKEAYESFQGTGGIGDGKNGESLKVRCFGPFWL